MENGGRQKGAIRGFRDLEVYALTRQEAKGIYQMSKRFLRDEMYSLTDQIRRSSRAVSGMIAEAWAKRRYPAAFISKLTEALGEAMETQAWLDHALDCQYITDVEHRAHDAGWQSIGAMITRMIDRANTFCRPPS